jgi:hypothetical protein
MKNAQNIFLVFFSLGYPSLGTLKGVQYFNCRKLAIVSVFAGDGMCLKCYMNQHRIS